MVETIERRCVTGVDPHKRFPVPIEGQFDEDEFLMAPELEVVGKALIAKLDELGSLQAYPPTINYVWRAKAKKKQGHTILGFCGKLSGLAKFYGECDWTIEVSADAIRELQFTNFQVEALLFHELNHIEVVVDDETGEVSYKVRGEDAYAFVTEIKRYGAWKSDLGTVADAWNQAPLFGGSAISSTEAVRNLAEMVDGDGLSSITISSGGQSATLTPENTAHLRNRGRGAVEATRTNLVTATADA